MPLWVCECGCVPGVCTGENCDCEGHALDPVPDAQLQRLLISYAGYTMSDVVGKTRNQLCGMMADSDESEKLLAKGVEFITRRLPRTSDSVLRSLIDKHAPTAHGSARRTAKKKKVKKACTADK